MVSEASANIAMAFARKEAGNVLFKAGAFEKAIREYQQIFAFVDCYDGGSGPTTSEETAQIKELKVAHFSNLAMCHLKLGHTEQARASCSEAIAIDPGNIKALFRRGRCNSELGKLEEAQADLDAVLAKDPSNKEAMRELNALKERLDSQRKQPEPAEPEVAEPEVAEPVAQPVAQPVVEPIIKKGFLEQPDGFGGEQPDGMDVSPVIRVTPCEVYCIRARELLMEDNYDQSMQFSTKACCALIW